MTVPHIKNELSAISLSFLDPDNNNENASLLSPREVYM